MNRNYNLEMETAIKKYPKIVSIHFDEGMEQEDKIKVLKGLRKNFPNYDFNFSYGLTGAIARYKYEPNGITFKEK